MDNADPHGSCQSSDFDFDLTPREKRVRINDRTYVLTEADEGAATQYRDAQIRCTRLGPEGNVLSVDGIASTEPLLVSLCLFEEPNNNGSGRVPAGLVFVNKLPSRVVKKMFNWIQDNSDLAETNERVLLGEALAMKGSPVTVGQLRSWAVTNLDHETYKPLIKWLEPTAEEKAKNEQSWEATATI